MHGAVKCSRVGESAKIKWKGTTLGFSDIPSGSGCKLQITINNGKPTIIERSQVNKYNNAGLFYLPELKQGEHTAVFKIIELPAGVEYYMGQILVVGSVIQ